MPFKKIYENLSVVSTLINKGIMQWIILLAVLYMMFIQIPNGFNTINTRIDTLKNNDLAHITKPIKIEQSILVQENKLPKSTYIALWNEEPIK